MFVIMITIIMWSMFTYDGWVWVRDKVEELKDGREGVFGREERDVKGFGNIILDFLCFLYI